MPLQLYPFQQEDVKFLLERNPKLNNKPHKLLAHDPGVGKTPSVCVALRDLWNAVIVCPVGLKTTWAKRLVEWGAFRPHRIQIINKGSDICDFENKHVFIVSYELLLFPWITEQLKSRRADAFVVDECHRLQNMDAKITKVILGEDALVRIGKHKWFLSGTFMQNRPVNMFPTLKVLAPEVIKPYDDFAKYTTKFCGGFYDTDKSEWNANGSTNLPNLRNRLLSSGFMRRLELRDVYPEIPEAIEDEIYVDIDIEESEADTQPTILEKLVGIAKIPLVVDFAKDFLKQNPTKKLLIFTRNREVTQRVCDELEDYGAIKYYGGMSPKEKDWAKNCFIQNWLCRVAVVNRKSGGEGLDGWQHVCHHILEAQMDWNRGLEKQGFGRLDRKGQTEKVRIYRMVAVGTIEEKIVFSYHQKTKVFDYLFKTEKQTRMSVDKFHGELISLLTRGVVALEKMTGVPTGAAEGKVSEPQGTSKSAGAADKKTTTAKSATSATAGNEKTAAKESQEKPALTLDDVREYATRLAQEQGDEGKAMISEIVKSNGADLLKNLKPAKFAAVIEALKEALGESGEAETSEEGDAY